ncbi:MAG: ATP-binding protein, partial [Deltaproteobacteria bacterium]|nr:ATP-binding protein [Deltaproteobacteria bacterium]
SFETLRQTCMNPEGRAFIGKEPPRGALPNSAIRSVEVSHAPWMKPGRIELNPGLIAIIGARGSGKTALADFIAMGGCAVFQHLSDKSFLRRAGEHLRQSEVQLQWESGDTTSNAYVGLEMEDLVDAPHVQYLSQQFVDQLCSAEGLEDPLVREIERVVFDAHSEGDRLDATSFEELLNIRLEGARTSRNRHVQAISRTSEAMTAEQSRKDGLPALLKDRAAKLATIQTEEAGMKALMPKGDAARAQRHDVVAAAVEAKRGEVIKVKVRLEALQHLVADVKNLRERELPDMLEGLRLERAGAALPASDWEKFKLVFAGDVDAVLTQRLQEAKNLLRTLEGNPMALTVTPDTSVPLLADTDDLTKQPLMLLERELARLRTLVGMDAQNARRFKQMSDRVATARIALTKLDSEISKGQGSNERIDALRQQRRSDYVGVFQAVLEEEKTLQALYQPLKAQIAKAQGSLAKLAFTVKRDVDLDAWCDEGESLLDLRSAGAFKGKGSLRSVASQTLLDAWQTGDAAQAGEALQQFIAAYSADPRGHRPEPIDSKEWA